MYIAEVIFQLIVIGLVINFSENSDKDHPFPNFLICPTNIPKCNYMTMKLRKSSHLKFVGSTNKSLIFLRDKS